MGPADSRRITRVPRYSGVRLTCPDFAYRTVTFCGPSFQTVPLVITCHHGVPTTPPLPEDSGGLGSSPVARHYWGNHSLFSFPAGTKMFQFPAFASRIGGIISLQDIGLSHSEIRGSRAICASPRLFAAYHVLHRLREPRHPPCALIYFLVRAVPHGTARLILSAVLRHNTRSRRGMHRSFLNYSFACTICQRSS